MVEINIEYSLSNQIDLNRKIERRKKKNLTLA
jgi:hypothetical protein